MRPYSNSKSGYAKVGKARSQAGEKKKRAERYNTEWDIRIDCSDTYCDEIVQNLADNGHLLEYCLISGREQPDTVAHGSKDIHVHIAIILKYAMRRDQVLSLCRGALKRTDEYCCPRNRKFTYAGWFMHHTKLDYKLVTEQPIKWEFGILPSDDLTEENKKKAQQMFKKFAMDDEKHQEYVRNRFIDILTE